MTNFESVIDKSRSAKATRLSFGEALAELGAKNEKVVVLDADLSKSTRTDLFAAKFPDRFYEMGISEANMIGVAAGLSFAGWVPFAASFGCFLTGRFDQIRMSIAFAGANVRLVGTHSGVSIGEDGHSQMALEDLTLMRALPNMTVFQPADEDETKAFIEWSLEYNGPVYLRLTRQNLPALKRSSPVRIEPGKWERLDSEKDFKDKVVLIASGGLVPNTLLAATELVKFKNLNFCVVNASWIKPYDGAMLDKIVQEGARCVVTLEDHYTQGGLATVVAEHFSKLSQHPKLLRIGVEGFGQSGSPEQNQEAYGLSSKKIAAKLAELL